MCLAGAGGDCGASDYGGASFLDSAFQNDAGSHMEPYADKYWDKEICCEKCPVNVLEQRGDHRGGVFVQS